MPQTRPVRRRSSGGQEDSNAPYPGENAGIDRTQEGSAARECTTRPHVTATPAKASVGKPTAREEWPLLSNRSTASSASAERGELWFRIIIGTASAVTVCALAGVLIFLLRLPTPPGKVYFDLQRQADIIYLAFWMSIALLAGVLTIRPRTAFLAFNVMLVIGAEGVTHAYFYAMNGFVYQPVSNVIITRFEPHPLLVGIPHPGRFGEFSHDADHHRATWNEGKLSTAKSIFTFGGSTTYDVGNTDPATWSSNLSKLLGKDFAVTNHGVPGYSSLEHMIQSLFAFRDARPTCAIYYVGWNDLRNAHIKNLRNDYSDFHLPSQVTSLAVGHRPGFLENNMLLVRSARLLFFHRPIDGLAYDGEPPSAKDERLSRIFMENMKLIAEINHYFDVKPIFVPQVLNYERLLSDRSSAWVPAVPDKDVKGLMRAMNADLAEVARQAGTLFLDTPLDGTLAGCRLR